MKDRFKQYYVIDTVEHRELLTKEEHDAIRELWRSGDNLYNDHSYYPMEYLWDDEDEVLVNMFGRLGFTADDQVLIHFWW